MSGLIILWSGWDTDWKLGVAILLGYVILGPTRVFRLNSHNPVMQWRAAQWLPVYLIGLGLIVYLSPYGPLRRRSSRCGGTSQQSRSSVWSSTTGRMGCRSPTEEIEHMVNEVVPDEEEGLAEMPIA